MHRNVDAERGREGEFKKMERTLEEVSVEKRGRKGEIDRDVSYSIYLHLIVKGVTRKALNFYSDIK